MANKDEKAREPARPYVFREGMVWKGGRNPDVSRITVRPDPPAPLGNTGGVDPEAPADQSPAEAPQGRQDSPATTDGSSD